MGIRLDCDRCGRVIKNISIKQIRNLDEKDGVCQPCLEAEKQNNRDYERLKNRFITKLNDLLNAAQAEYQALLKKQVEKRTGGE